MRITKFLFLGTLLLAGGLRAQGKPNRELHVALSVDLNRYSGTWYEIARLPNWFQKKCAGEVVATYKLLEGGEIEVTNRCLEENGETRTAKGKARLANKTGPSSKLEVRFAPAFLSFLPMVWGDYWVIDLAPDYSYAVVGEPSRKYLWILSRSPKLDPSLYQSIVSRVATQDYDVSRLVKTTQATAK